MSQGTPLLTRERVARPRRLPHAQKDRRRIAAVQALLLPLSAGAAVVGETFTTSARRGGGLRGVPLDRHRRLPEYNDRLDPS